MYYFTLKTSNICPCWTQHLHGKMYLDVFILSNKKSTEYICICIFQKKGWPKYICICIRVWKSYPSQNESLTNLRAQITPSFPKVTHTENLHVALHCYHRSGICKVLPGLTLEVAKGWQWLEDCSWWKIKSIDSSYLKIPAAGVEI